MKESMLTDLFWPAGFFLVFAALVVPIMRFCKIPAALGYLFAGVILGPYALGTMVDLYPVLSPIALKESEQIEMLAELGIVLLLFVIGLEITPRRLWQMRHLVFGLGGTQVLVTSAVIGTIAFLWGNNVQVSVLIGLGLALSSTAIIMQWIQEQKLFATDVGRSSFSILLFQDLAVVPILLLLTIMSADIEENVAGFVSLSLFKMVATVAAIYVAGKVLLKPVFVFANKHGGAEVFVALILLVIIASASVASFAGLSMAFGAFVAGLLLADTEYKHEIYSLIIPFKSMLIGIFFMSFGMGINLHFIADKPLWLMISVVGLMLIKAGLIFFLCKLWRQTTAVSVESAVLLSQAGEFGLLVVGTALTVGLMEQEVGQFMLLTVAITMIFAPIFAPFARKIGKLAEKTFHSKQSYHTDQADKKSQHIVIFGFGRVGKEIGNTLCAEGYEILAFDQNVERIKKAHQNNAPVYMGDASKKSTLEAANIEEALCVVVTLDDAVSTRKILKEIRKIDESIPVIIRAHNIEDRDAFNDFKYVEAIAENELVSNALSKNILQQVKG